MKDAILKEGAIGKFICTTMYSLYEVYMVTHRTSPGFPLKCLLLSFSGGALRDTFDPTWNKKPREENVL